MIEKKNTNLLMDSANLFVGQTVLSVICLGNASLVTKIQLILKVLVFFVSSKIAQNATKKTNARNVVQNI